MYKAIFLDRDGVINHNKEYYTYRIDDVIINKGIIESLRLFIQNQFKIFVITNQSGIAKGVYTHAEVEQVHQYMQNQFREFGVDVTAFYYCPHHPDVGKCICRKPDSLLIEKAIARFDIDKGQSHFIGDSARDIQAAEKAGVKGHLIHSNESILMLAQLICML
jgi:D,D-heptose 1,7-bisphosphate phosphatase